MKRVLYCLYCSCLLVLVAGCAPNDYDYFGKEVLSTPYDGPYRRVEDYLQRQSGTAVAQRRPASLLGPPVPLIAPPPASLERP